MKEKRRLRRLLVADSKSNATLQSKKKKQKLNDDGDGDGDARALPPRIVSRAPRGSMSFESLVYLTLKIQSGTERRAHTHC